MLWFAWKSMEDVQIIGEKDEEKWASDRRELHQ